MKYFDKETIVICHYSRSFHQIAFAMHMGLYPLFGCREIYQINKNTYKIY